MYFLPQFRLRTMLLIISLVAVWIAWHHPSPDARAIAAIEQTGGTVHLNGHLPQVNSMFTSVAMLPDYVYCSQPTVSRHIPVKSFSDSVWELFIGTSDNRVRIVEMAINEMTPDIVRHLHSLDDLNVIILDMPQGMFPRESELGNRLTELETEFKNRILPRSGQFIRSNTTVLSYVHLE
ncbi:MAG: hypothetical protein AAF497_06635 [Planctomycetota bacterium]